MKQKGQGVKKMKASELEMRVRDSAALVVATLAEAKPKTFGKTKGLLQRMATSDLPF